LVYIILHHILAPIFYAADNYHHHVATNTWIGTNILPASNNYDKPGLDHHVIILPDDEEINRLKKRFMESKVSISKITKEPYKHYSSSFYVCDPDRIKMQFLCK
jgi:catechol 2,3-dioxygenase